jgi:catechol 2,3-dioxygenase-like lactoylglutathione lyase family enzyme
MELRSVHICLEVSDFQRAISFWGPLLAVAGFAQGWSDAKSYAGFTNGAMTLFFGESTRPRIRRGAPTGQEFVVTEHVGFSVARREDVDAIVAAMDKAGVAALFPAAEYREFGPGFYAVTYCDPDNNVIEFNHRSAPAPGEAPEG